MIELSQRQIKQIARSISVLNIKAYIEQHRQEYEQFLEEEKKKEQKNKAVFLFNFKFLVVCRKIYIYFLNFMLT